MEIIIFLTSFLNDSFLESSAPFETDYIFKDGKYRQAGRLSTKQTRNKPHKATRALPVFW